MSTSWATKVEGVDQKHGERKSSHFTKFLLRYSALIAPIIGKRASCVASAANACSCQTRIESWTRLNTTFGSIFDWHGPSVARWLLHYFEPFSQRAHALQRSTATVEWRFGWAPTLFFRRCILEFFGNARKMQCVWNYQVRRIKGCDSDKQFAIIICTTVPVDCIDRVTSQNGDRIIFERLKVYFRSEWMTRESLNTSVPSLHFHSRSGMLNHTGGTYSHDGMTDLGKFLDYGRSKLERQLQNQSIFKNCRTSSQIKLNQRSWDCKVNWRT